jgi:hypothetical protein
VDIEEVKQIWCIFFGQLISELPSPSKNSNKALTTSLSKPSQTNRTDLWAMIGKRQEKRKYPVEIGADRAAKETR